MNKKLLLLSLLIVSGVAKGGENKSFVKLEDTVITTQNFETTVRDTPTNISIITAEEIEKSGSTNLVQVLRDVPGLFAREYAGGEIRFDLRGQNPMYANKNIIVTIDGVPINRTGLGSSDSYNLSQIPVERIERIEVIPSGGAVLYGDGSVGGIINITTKTVEDRQNYGSINFNAGSHGLFSENITYGTKIGNNFLNEISFSKYNSHGSGRKLSDGTKEKVDKYSFDYTGKYLLDNGDIEFKYSHAKSETHLGGTIPQYIFDENIKYASKFSKSKYELNDFYLKYRAEVSDSLESVTYINYLHNDYSPYSGGFYNTNRYKERKEYVKSQLKYKYLENNYLIFGADYSHHREKDSMANLKTYKDGREAKKEAYGIFLMNKIEYNKFQFIQGIRKEYTDYDYYLQKLKDVNDPSKYYDMESKKFNNTGLEFAINYLYSDTGSTYINYTRGFRTPSATEMGSYEPILQGVYEYNRKSQTSDNIEIGIKDFVGNTYLSASVYYNKIDNYMYSKIPTNIEDWDKSITGNLGKVDKYGTDIVAEHYIGNLTLRTGISYIHHELKDGPTKGEPIPSVPNWKITAGTTYNFTPKFSASVDALYHGSYTVLDALKYKVGTLPESGDESSLEKYDEKVDSYITVDLSTSYQFENGLTLTARVDNLFDKKYDRYVGAWGDFSGDSTYVVQQHLPAPGRTFTVGALYKF